MFYIAESDSQLERLKDLGRAGGYIEVITSNDYYHPKFTKAIAVYIRPLVGTEGFIIPIDHNEGLNVEKERINEILLAYAPIYTLNKKTLLYYFNIQEAIDLSLLYSMIHYDKLEVPTKNTTYNWYYNHHREFANVNQLIPITKLYEKCEQDYEYLKPIIKTPIPECFDFYNKTATNVFFLIEQHGLGIKQGDFLQAYNPSNVDYSIKDSVIYTQYNLCNTTSRPTNAFNSINFAALPKKVESRECIVPQNDYFCDMDFDGYHIRLLSEQIGYPLTDESAHKQLARLYFEKSEITPEEYDQAKQINFQALYGRIPEQYKHLEFFVKVQRFIDTLWGEYTKTGKVLAPISGKPFTKDLHDMNPQKLMNYIMQSLETSRNILILKELLRYLKDKKTKIALYVYDSITLDFNKEDGKQSLVDIENILSEGGKYPIKFKFSKNLVLN